MSEPRSLPLQRPTLPPVAISDDTSAGPAPAPALETGTFSLQQTDGPPQAPPSVATYPVAGDNVPTDSFGIADPAQLVTQRANNAPRPVSAPAASTPGVQDITGELDDDLIELDDLLLYLMEIGGSDLHLAANTVPMVRLRGEIVPVPNYGQLSGRQIETAMFTVMTAKQRAKFDEDWELDFAYTIPGQARFRVNVFRQRQNIGAVLRVIPWEVKSLEALGMPPVIETFADLPRGFVLVTGPTGSGKSTTLAALIDKANRTRSGHIMTVEDPIEFIHQNRSSLVNQREIGEDTHSYASALKYVLRQDPDIILVGELRDLETISVALTAAETGHLVFATLHTQSAEETISRIVDVFPANQQAQVRTQLAACLQAVVCQTLCKTADGLGRVAAVEVMVCDPAVRTLIREGKLHQIQSALQAGRSRGNQTLNQSLAELVQQGKISLSGAQEKCTDRADLANLIGAMPRAVTQPVYGSGV